MPAHLAINASRLTTTAAEAYVCPACFLNATGLVRQYRYFSGRPLSKTVATRKDGNPRAKLLKATRPLSPHEGIRHYTTNETLASTTAINAPSTVPPAYRDLHQKLSALQETASSHVNLSRLQLAQRSLEGSNPVVRVALLGLGSNGGHAARKLARAILSDALDDEQPWEQELVQSAKDGRSLLLRYLSLIHI